jgi:broad specificity phosphatase PhoE
MTRLILVRHAETEANVSQVWHGSADAPLTERGWRQVEATARRIAELAQQYPVDAFYVSPLPRAQSTAAAIAQALRREPRVDRALREFDLGDWEGRTFQELKEAERLWERWAVDPTFAPPNGESPRSFGERAVTATLRLAGAHAGETLLIVTHGGFICHVLAYWIGGGFQDWRRWEPHNCAISLLEGDGDRWAALLVNDVSHLAPADVVDEPPVY